VVRYHSGEQIERMASEIFAAALQDTTRGIVGDSVPLGKAPFKPVGMGRFIPLLGAPAMTLAHSN